MSQTLIDSISIYKTCLLSQMLNTSSLADEDTLVPPYKIILLGKGQAGKTKLLVRYIYGSYTDKGMLTVMIDCSYKKRQNIRYAYYDTAGQEIYRTILNLHIKGSDAAILIYDTNNMKSFEELHFYYNKVKQQIPDCLVYIIGCKSDLETNVPLELVQRTYRAQNYFLTSAKQGLGVQQAFQQIQSDLLVKKKTCSGIKLSTGKLSTLRSSYDKKTKKCCQ